MAKRPRDLDYEGSVYYIDLPKRKRAIERSHMLAERLRLRQAERESFIWKSIDEMHLQLRDLKRGVRDFAIPVAKYRSGHSKVIVGSSL